MVPDSSSMTPQAIEAVAFRLLGYCRENNWAGYDPYDALNGRLFSALPILNSRLARLALTQVLKRSPLNVRALLGVPKTQNPKALALFLMAFVKLSEGDLPDRTQLISSITDDLRTLRSPGTNYWCWGYSFPWQTRTILVPKGAPNLVCTSFVANALFDAFDNCGDSRCLNMALSAVEYILNELYWSDDSSAGFSYPVPSLRSQVHNANLLAAALLCRAFSHTKEQKFLLPALGVARYSAAKQRPDGSWPYGEVRSQQWIDNFHTGYNLCALQSISRYSAAADLDEVVRRGFEFYRSHFFRKDGSVAYFHDRIYPIDIHCVAQSIITLLAFKDLDPGSLAQAHTVLRWALTHLWDERGFFYYRILRSCTNRLPYMRWSQAWMLLAIVTLLEHSK